MKKFRSVRTLAQIKADERVSSVSVEGANSIWVYLRRPYVDAGREMSCIHEATVAECCHILNNDISCNLDLFNSLLGI